MRHPAVRTTEAVLRLRPGVRVSRRGDGRLQVGLHPDRRVLLPDTPDVRRLLRDLGPGTTGSSVPPALAADLQLLRARGLVGDPAEDAVGARLLGAARVGVVAADPERATAVRMLAAARVQVSGRRSTPTVVLLVTTGAEPRRELLDRWMREDLPHLSVTAVAGRVRVGPLVVPGLTACQRCVDEHLTDRDPRHPLVLAQHHAPDPRDRVAAADLQLALARAVADLAGWVGGRRPASWSTTTDLGDEVVHQAWTRHPRCGCAWGDSLTG